MTYKDEHVVALAIDGTEQKFSVARPASWPPTHTTFALGDLVSKRRGSSWHGRIVGWYSTSLTPEGYAVESDHEPGSVQIYPAAALQKWSPYQQAESDLECFRDEDPTT